MDTGSQVSKELSKSTRADYSRRETQFLSRLALRLQHARIVRLAPAPLLLRSAAPFESPHCSIELTLPAPSDLVAEEIGVAVGHPGRAAHPEARRARCERRRRFLLATMRGKPNSFVKCCSASSRRIDGLFQQSRAQRLACRFRQLADVDQRRRRTLRAVAPARLHGIGLQQNLRCRRARVDRVRSNRSRPTPIRRRRETTK